MGIDNVAIVLTRCCDSQETRSARLRYCRGMLCVSVRVVATSLLSRPRECEAGDHLDTIGGWVGKEATDRNAAL